MMGCVLVYRFPLHISFASLLISDNFSCFVQSRTNTPVNVDRGIMTRLTLAVINKTTSRKSTTIKASLRASDRQLKRTQGGC
jgi:hypothetical protein